MKRKLASAAGLLAACSAVQGDTITFTFKFDKPVLQPGDVQKISVWADLDPSVGQTALYQGTYPSTVAAFGSAHFDLVNVANAQSGMYSDLATNPGFMGWPTQLGNPDGKGGVVGIVVGQFSFNSILLVASDPVLIWQATWTPDHYDPREVGLGLAQDPANPPTALLDFTFIPLNEPWEFASEPGSFQIIPAPATAPLLAAALLMCRRRRRCECGRRSVPRRE